MTIRILADREPYASYATRYSEKEDAKGPSGPFVILSGPDPLDGPTADLVAMPAEDFLAHSAARRGGGLVIAYGAAACMDAAFESGCADFLREPWPLLELLARAARLLNPRVKLGGAEFFLVGNRLSAVGSSSVELSETERKLASLLMHNAGLPVTRAALSYALCDNTLVGSRSLDNHISSLRKKMEQVQNGSGKSLSAIRGVGYRLTLTSCG